MTVTELRDGLYVDDGIDRTTVFRVYEVSAVLGEEDALGPPFPQVGDSDKHYDNAICVSRRVLKRLADVGQDHNGDVGRVFLAGALFRSNNPFGGGLQGGSETDVNGSIPFEVPGYTLVNGQYDYRPLRAFRPSITRRVARIVPNDLLEVEQAIEAFAGHLFDLDNNGNLLQLAGGRARDTGTGVVIVVYEFRRNAAIKAVAPGEIPGSDIQIPELPSLHEYVTVWGNPPVIDIVIPTSWYFEADPSVLPGL